MKKLFKCIGTLAAVAAAVAGGLAVYKKFFAPEEDLDDLDEELEEEFEEDLDAPKRDYVSLNTCAEKVEKAAEEVTEEVKEAAKDIAEEVKETAKEAVETAAEAAEEIKEEAGENE